MSKLRKAARGQPCYLRLPGCSHDPDRTVLCHIRRGNVAGMASKPSDFFAIPMDDHCHNIYDQRVKSIHSRSQLDADVLRGLGQWLSWLEKEGYIREFA